VVVPTCMAELEVCTWRSSTCRFIGQMRRKLVEEGPDGPAAQETLQTIHKTGNSSGEGSASVRPGPSAAVCGKGARKERSMCCGSRRYASFDPRTRR